MFAFVRGARGRIRLGLAASAAILACADSASAQGFPESPVQPPPVFPVVQAGGDLSAPPVVVPAVPWAIVDAVQPAAGGAPATLVPPAATAPATPLAFEAVWNNGLFFQTKDKHFVAHVGGTIHYDGAWYSASDAVQFFPGGIGKISDGVNLRRARLYMEGSMHTNIDYKFEMEFMNGFSPAGLSGPVAVNTVSNSPGPTDAWVTIKNVPFLGNVRVGSQKEWFSLEHLNGYRYLEFMERSYLFDFSQATAFNNGFSPGISTFRTWADDRVFTAIGAYKNESDLLGFGLGNGQYSVTGRLAALPVWMPDEQRFWHVGGAMSHRDPVNGQVQVRIRNEVRNAPFPLLNLIANTGAINATSQDLFNLETAAVIGPLTLQGEYTANLIHGAQVGTGPNQGTVRYQGFYAEAMVFLTGESRTWDPKLGIFKRVSPERNFLIEDGCWSGGTGAVELAARYTYLDLDDKAILGGRLNDVTLGLNWYLNPNVRFQFNYDYLYRDGGPNPLAKGQVHSVGTRLAFDL